MTPYSTPLALLSAINDGNELCGNSDVDEFLMNSELFVDFPSISHRFLYLNSQFYL